MDRQEQLFHSLRRFNSYMLTLVTFISEDAQEIYYNNTRREVKKDYNCFPGTSEWEQKEKCELSIGALKYLLKKKQNKNTNHTPQNTTPHPPPHPQLQPVHILHKNCSVIKGCNGSTCFSLCLVPGSFGKSVLNFKRFSLISQAAH